MKFDRDKINDGDILSVDIVKNDNEPFVCLGLSHRANNWHILLTKRELELLLESFEDNNENSS